MSVLYQHDYSRCLAETIGPAGVSARVLGDNLQQTASSLARLKAGHDDGSLAFLRQPAMRSDQFREIGEKFRSAFEDVVVLGIGGSSLGGRTLCALAEPDATRIHFMENIDPWTFDRMIRSLFRDSHSTGVIAISKSGSTAETLTQTAIVIDTIRSRHGEAMIGEKMVVITEPGDSALASLADRFGIDRLEHDPELGGRYAALSVVGLLPALIAGLDVEAVREGARTVLAPVLEGHDPSRIPAACGAAVSVGLCRENGISATVLMPYSDRLSSFSRWYGQLWAESLGKKGHGTVPVAALGAVDQHSQLQLWLDGPRDKMFTFILPDTVGKGSPVPADVSAMEGLAWLKDRTMGDLLAAEGRATAETLARGNRPARIIRVEEPNAGVLGAIMMHFMLETVIAADLLGVNAFDQPAVEAGKVLARKYLAGEGVS